jgi:hypothetical protein
VLLLATSWGKVDSAQSCTAELLSLAGACYGNHSKPLELHTLTNALQLQIAVRMLAVGIVLQQLTVIYVCLNVRLTSLGHQQLSPLTYPATSSADSLPQMLRFA